jgi:hypothetical protein
LRVLILSNWTSHPNILTRPGTLEF